MGAWGSRIFEDDSTSDWYYEFCENGSKMEDIQKAFKNVLASDFIDYDDGSAALAAAEILAAALGRPSADYPTNDPSIDPEEMDVPEADLDGIAAKITPELLQLAVRAVDRVHTFDESELSSVWEDDDDRADVIRGLKLRLKN